MYRLLIVDDEIHAVNGIKAGIEWSKLEISEVHTAYNNRQAKEIFANHPIDLMICDIEMPQGSGLELLAWIRENHGSTKCIFLTCHADFQYAKEAIHLGSFDYLLKPVVFSELEEVIGKAVKAIRKEKEAQNTGEQSVHYYNLWLMHQPLLVERFWMDLIDGKIPAETVAIQQFISKADIHYTDRMRFLPVLIKVQSWHTKMLLRDERVKEHELRNQSLRILLKEDRLSQVLQLKRGLFLAVHVSDLATQVDKFHLKADYQSYLESCSEKFGCDISCYIGDAGEIQKIPEAYEALLEFSKDLVILNRVILIGEHIVLQNMTDQMTMQVWHEMFTHGKREKWRSETDSKFAALARLEIFDAGSLYDFFQDFMQMIYSVLKEKDLPAHLIYSQGERPSEEELSLNSVHALQELVTRIGERVFDFTLEADKERSITEKIKLYISQNMGYDLTRESIAKVFYLNPDYLTRIFKKETGFSISDYLIHERVRIAKDLLVNTDLPVKDIVSKIGYTNFSYFSKLFKEATGLSPLAFRKANAN